MVLNFPQGQEHSMVTVLTSYKVTKTRGPQKGLLEEGLLLDNLGGVCLWKKRYLRGGSVRSRLGDSTNGRTQV